MMKKREGGFILVSLYMMLGLFLVFSVALTAHALTNVRASQRISAGTQGFYLAEAGIDRAVQWLRAQGSPPVGTQTLVLFGGWQPLGEGSYLATVDPDDSNPNSYVKRYILEGWGAAGLLASPLAVRRTHLIVQAESFSRFAYLTHSDTTPSGSRIWFVTGDRIEGPAHTNGQFNMYGRPVFDGPVSSVSPTLNQWGGGPPTTQPVFNDGLHLGAPTVPFPFSVPAALVNAASQDGIRLNGDTQVTLLSNGTMRVTNSAQGLNNQTMPLPSNGVLYVAGGNLTLAGTLRGQLTAATDRDVRIAGSITYASNPRVNPSSTDLLGVLTGGNIRIASTAPMNVEVDGSLMALGTSFTVENYDRSPPKGTLTVYGGIIQRNRGPVGTASASTGQKISGYTKDYHYDSRLRSMTPPFFPTTGAYTPLVWEETD